MQTFIEIDLFSIRFSVRNIEGDWTSLLFVTFNHFFSRLVEPFGNSVRLLFGVKSNT